MTIVRSLAELRKARSELKGRLGFVPTMGYLHEGHLSLLKRAKESCDVSVVSIFVNPSQFGPGEDFEQYPRDEARDLALLASLNGGPDLVWFAQKDEMYPTDYQTWINLERKSQGLEGERRPGHFRGVATIVTKLFNSVQPQAAFFGLKDYQQYRVISRMVADLNMPIDIVGCPIIREDDGLAKSSRNVYLSPEERAASPVLFRALSAAKAAYEKGERQASVLVNLAKKLITSEPLFTLDYLECSDAETLQKLTTIDGPAVISLAAKIGKTRLLDNIVLGK